MRRTQLNLDDWQYEAIRSRADRDGRSISDVVREALAEYLVDEVDEGRGALLGLRGVADDPESSGRDHDRLLYGEPDGVSSSRRRGDG
ncbi:MAG: ribbon-helix-helix protein, CopG family [Acidobacteria bacterium]|nr:ribbon-helix-helix protein, CopG family [Acidobacteriota bacterium]